MSYSSVGQVFDIPAFRTHVAGQNLSWAKGVCVHHTGTPNLAQRPTGWTIQHMRNLASYYGAQLGWSAGPHLFTDEDQIYGLSPLSARGVHAVSFNSAYIGIEMLGDYDRESPIDGRGKQVLDMSAATVAVLLHRMKLPVNGDTVKFHRDDPLTSKTCPGRLVDKNAFLAAVGQKLSEIDSMEDRGGNVPESNPNGLQGILSAMRGNLAELSKSTEPKATAAGEKFAQRIDSIRWQIDQIEKEFV